MASAGYAGDYPDTQRTGEASGYGAAASQTKPKSAAELASGLQSVRTMQAIGQTTQTAREKRERAAEERRRENLESMDLEMGGRALESLRKQQAAKKEQRDQPYAAAQQWERRQADYLAVKQQADELEQQLKQAQTLQLELQKRQAYEQLQEADDFSLKSQYTPTGTAYEKVTTTEGV